MDRVKRISNELLMKYPNRFGVDFNENKKNIGEVAILRSKLLRNKVAGYIASYFHKQATQNSRGSLSPDLEEEGDESGRAEI